MKTAILIAAILHMQGVRTPHPKHCLHYKRAAAAAPAILRQLHAERSRLDPVLVAAVIGKESSFRWTKGGEIITGDDGEIGWLQIKPDGRAERFCQDLDIHDPDGNLACGIRLLEAARRTCGGDPRDFLSSYNGLPCGPSDYSDKVLRLYGHARPAVALTP